MKYINAEKLKELINEKRKELADENVKVGGGKRDAEISTYSSVLRLIDSLQQEQSEVELEKEIYKWIAEGDITDIRFGDYDDLDIERTARHFYELGFNARKPMWHSIAEETPTDYGSEVIVACRNKNKEDGIWLYDLIQCWEGKWEPRVNWETPVKWAYVEDLDNARKEE